MNIGLVGYGKMGRTIEALATERGHQIAWRIDQDNLDAFQPELIRQAEVAIEFTRPEAAFDNVMRCMQAGIPVVSGTTGWLNRLPEAQQWCRDNQGALLWASNFSVGVNLLFALNRLLAQWMNQRPEYDPSITETHHVHKLDAPSGTALTLAYDIIHVLDRKNGWKLHPAPCADDELDITAIREDEVPGTHRIEWSSAIDSIVLEHAAHNRSGFAGGALLAAEWLKGKTGVFTMQDVLNIFQIAPIK